MDQTFASFRRQFDYCMKISRAYVPRWYLPPNSKYTHRTNTI